MNKVSIVCKACCMGKSSKLPFSPSSTIYTAPLQLIYTNIWGPSPVPLSNGCRYYIHFLDAHTKFTWSYLLHNKSQACKPLLNFKQWLRSNLIQRSKWSKLQSDCGKEFTVFSKYLTSQGILYRFSYPYTHEQNGSAEHKHRHIQKWD